MDYIFKRIEKNDLSETAFLYKDCFDIDISVSELKDKYDTAYVGLENVGFFSFKGAEVAAYYGVFPERFYYNGAVIIVGQSGDTMTGANHRKKGLFVKLAKETYKLAEELNMRFVFGFPNEFSFPGFQKKLNWKFYGNMNLFEIKTNVALPLCELASKYKKLKSLYRKRIQKRLKFDISTVENFDYTNSFNGVYKDKAFIKHKLNKSKDVYLIKSNGFKLIIKTEPHLIIGEVAFFKKEKLNDFVSTILDIAKKTYAKKIQISLSQNHWLNVYLKEIYTPIKSLPIGFYEIDPTIDYASIIFSGIDYDTF